MSTLNIAILPGDGIGPEVMQEALKVMETLSALDSSFQFNTEELPWNSDYFLTHGQMMPDDGLDRLKKFDAILFGAIGDSRVPDETTIWELIMPIRKQFQQYINFRPIKKLNGISSPLKEEYDIDFVVIRENAEGEYSNSGGRLYAGAPQEVAIQNTIMTRQGIQKISEFAFQYAQKNNRKKVTSATKSNAIIHSMKLWDEVTKEVASAFPLIRFEQNYIDALAAYFVMRPQSFDVVIASNLFGDILTDLGAALVGGLGIAPSANLNPEKEYPSMFEPIHGSAPDIAGKNIANPIAQIWSVALLLEFHDRKDLANIVLQSIQQVLIKREALTPDLGGKGTTADVGNAIVQALQEF